MAYRAEIARRIKANGHNQSTRSGNTGVRNARAVFVDWLAFHLPAEAVQEFETRYPWPVVSLNRGMYGYSHCGVILDTGRVCWSPLDPQRGRHVSLPAGALAMIADVPGLVGGVLELGGSVSRLDLAIDDYDGLLDMEKIAAALEDDSSFTSRWTSHSTISKTTHGKNSRTSNTIYLGSRRSEMFARIYDKAAEQHDRGNVPSRETWVRFELEAKKRKAHKLAALVVAQDWETIRSIIMSYLCFREPSQTDSTKSRWDVAGWWSDFLGTLERVSGFFSSEAERTLDQVQRWFETNMAPTLALAFEAWRGDLDQVLEVIVEGRKRWKPRHKAMLAAMPV